MGFAQGEGRVSACMLQSVRSCPSKKILNPTFEPSFIENNYLIVSLIAKLGGFHVHTLHLQEEGVGSQIIFIFWQCSYGIENGDMFDPSEETSTFPSKK